jgi:CBS domain-containing protein
MDKVERLLEVKGREVFSIGPEAMVWDAARLMAEKKVGALLVMKEQRVVGIFSERDILNRVVLPAKDAKTTPLIEVMSTDMVYVPPDATINEALAIMTERRCRHLPVICEEKLCGLVSIGDCTRWVSRNQDYTIRHLTDYIHSRYPG